MIEPIDTSTLGPVRVEADWPPLDRLSPENRAIVEQMRASTSALILGSANPGMAMRGISMAIADSFEPRHATRGLFSTLRGIRNAFAERRGERDNAG